VIRINLADGRTLTLDLDDETDFKTWRSLESDRIGQTGIRGVSVAREDLVVSVPRPKDFRTVVYSAEVLNGKEGEAVADKITIQADEIRVDVLLYRRTGIARVDLRRPGEARFLPQFERRDQS